MTLTPQFAITTRFILPCSLVVLLGGLGLFLQQHTSEQQRAQFSSRYGQALAQSAAQQAIEPAIAQDMISLQVILHALTKQANVMGATAHSVDNQLLVQSGTVAPQGPTDNYPKFTSPIALNDQIAGYITLTLDLTQTEKNTGLVVLWFMAIMVVILLLWLIDHPFNFSKTLNDSAVELTSYDTIDSEPAASVVIELTLLNIAKLHQQLAAETFQSRLEQLDLRLKAVLTLYTGFKHHFAHNRLSLRIEADSEHTACFHATCISLLIHRLNEQSTTPNFKIAAAITPFKTWANSDAILDGYLGGFRPAQKESAIWVDPQLINEPLHQKITLDEDHQLRAIKSPYNDLLARQEQQLKSLINTG